MSHQSGCTPASFHHLPSASSKSSRSLHHRFHYPKSSLGLCQGLSLDSSCFVQIHHSLQFCKYVHRGKCMDKKTNSLEECPELSQSVIFHTSTGGWNSSPCVSSHPPSLRSVLSRPSRRRGGSLSDRWAEERHGTINLDQMTEETWIRFGVGMEHHLMDRRIHLVYTTFGDLDRRFVYTRGLSGVIGPTDSAASFSGLRGWEIRIFGSPWGHRASWNRCPGRVEWNIDDTPKKLTSSNRHV